jgi:hypothetical protein
MSTVEVWGCDSSTQFGQMGRKGVVDSEVDLGLSPVVMAARRSAGWGVGGR